jgi:hypothetical protein
MVKLSNDVIIECIDWVMIADVFSPLQGKVWISDFLVLKKGVVAKKAYVCFALREMV